MTTSTPFFNPHQQLNEVVLVGLGGTGSQWARAIARIAYDLRRRRQHVPIIRFVDPDRITEANCGRQMFVPSEIGQFKAEVLARRFNLAMGLSISWHNEPFNATQHTGRYGTVLCGAVDNHLARQEMAKVSGILIDSGNHQASGQVCIGNSSDAKLIRQRVRKDEFDYLPNVALLFPEMLEPDPEETTTVPAPSCAELVEQGSQRLLINDLMGSIAAEYTYKLLNHLPITTFLTYVDLDVLAMRSIQISRQEVLARLPKQPKVAQRTQVEADLN